jgi:hypothetical protein
VVSAELRLFVDSCNACDWTTDVQLFELLEAWDEGAANWDKRESNVLWSTAGAGVGSRGTVALATMVAPFDLATEHAAMLPASLVQSWISNPTNNFGVTVVAMGGDGVRFQTREAANKAGRPLLTLRIFP